MMFLLRVAFRNVFRHRQRSFLMIVSVGFGLGALIFLRGFVSGAQHQMVKNITTLLTGDLQIVTQGLEEVYNTSTFIENPEAVRKILKEEPRIPFITERVIRGGLVSTGERSLGAFMIGIDPDQEEKVGIRRLVVQGRDLSPDDHKGVFLGEKLREILEIPIGDSIVLTSQDYYGSVTGIEAVVVGTFQTGNDVFDSGTVYLLKKTAQQMLSLDERVSAFLLQLGSGVDRTALVSRLRGRLPDKEIKVLTWEELIPVFAQMHRFQNGVVFIVMAIVVLVVAAGIFNTMMMSFLERIREFGLLGALGTKPSTIRTMVMMESWLLTGVGLLCGILLGGGLIVILAGPGIDLSRFISTFSNLFIGARVHPELDLRSLPIFIGVFFLASLLASLLPAWRAGRLTPVEAMRKG